MSVKGLASPVTPAASPVMPAAPPDQSNAPVARPIRRLLFLSKNYASDFGLRVGGVFQRMRVLLEAAASSTETLDILFFVDRDVIERIGPSAAQSSLARAWGIEATVHLAPRAIKSGGPLRHLAASIVDFRDNEDFFRYTGPEQLQAIRSLIRPDTGLVFAHRIYTAAAALKAIGPDIPVVTDLDDIEHRTQVRMWREPPWTIGKAMRFLEYPALRRGEIATIAACRDAFVCSSRDQSYLAGLGAPRTTVVPNTVRFARRAFAPAVEPGTTLFFIGTYNYPPNRDAATDLIETIFPLVRARRPATRLMIVGEGVEAIPGFTAPPPGVEFVGYVEDLDEAYRRASVVCCPIRVGGGTRIKIIEAVAHHRPVVSTSAGAEGLSLEDGIEILLRDTPEAFAEACVQLLDDPRRAATIAEAAHRRAIELYDRGAVVDQVAQRLKLAFSDSASR